MAPTMSFGTSRLSEMSCLDTDDLFAIFDITKDTKPKAADLPRGPSLDGFDPLLEMSESRDDPGIWSEDDNDSVVPRARTACVTDLRDIAIQLAKDKPRALTKEEELRITLGDSAKDSIGRGEGGVLRKTRSSFPKTTNTTDIRGSLSSKKKKENNVADFSSSSSERSAVKKAPKLSSGKLMQSKSDSKVSSSNLSDKDTPSKQSKSLRKSLVSKLSPNRPKGAKSPSDSPKSSPRSTIVAKFSPVRRKSTTSVPENGLAVPSLEKPSPTSFLSHATSMAERTSEIEPSPHQVEIPTSKELYEHGKLCALLDSYRKVDANFDFNKLKGIPRPTLKSFVSPESQTIIKGLTPKQKPIIAAYLDASDDVEVEGYFSHGVGNDKPEVAVFSTQSSRRFLVVHRGTTEQQLKTVRAKRSAAKLDSESPVSVYPAFRDCYFELETKLYGLLDKLVDKNPFCDVVFIGCSFGGALATIGAVRFAIARPMLRFACHTFGSPKVGTHDFRQMVNALPNLKVMRVECGHDPISCSPPDTSLLKWEHVGHTLAIHGGGSITAYRFDKKKPSSTKMLTSMRKSDIHAYVLALKPFALGKLPWVHLYAGEDVGLGVRGKDNETRLVV